MRHLLVVTALVAALVAGPALAQDSMSPAPATSAAAPAAPAKAHHKKAAKHHKKAAAPAAATPAAQ